ncbi:MAG: biopolymer transporter ExbD [Gammaproteobacteria bacterium]|nr:MAG: biopolymer transporter ExbD [Gammaproteobacteria bacterium]PIE37428.1 MAG: biopolymer transporter ExbD [Gammaproteobacteria bacterium]
MKFRRDPAEELELNLTPLIDVVFLLLIFFMVSTTFQKETELSLQLPKAASDAPVTEAQHVEITINAAGRFYVNDQELVQHDAASLQTAIHKMTGGRRDIPLAIRADAQAPHQAFVRALDAAGQLGISRISIAASRDTGQ